MFWTISVAAATLYLLGAVPASAQVTSSSADSASSETSSAPYYLEGKWTYPGVGPIGAAVEGSGSSQGEMLIDCQVGADGHLTACDLVAVSPGGTETARAITKVFLVYTHVDPASVSGGIQPGARKKFKYTWQ